MTEPHPPQYRGHDLIPTADGERWRVLVQFSDGRDPVKTNPYRWLSDAFAAACKLIDAP